MQYQPSRRATIHQLPITAGEIELLPPDDDADEFLDRHVAAIRESLADCRDS